ncbi:adenosylcobinamide kinase /adenosylcobinamide-phosphate guanylyltransferase [Litoreibacter ponti]|uniref:Bifunctional adenosylcobalamin biosynthesis protein n=1 Tax=Litoreibacter ponti TaxID=1510457 RepID=A0A2T6BEG6_9RHOB|nr:bifunctional adenosylcobinamide kinase/adenosylcobinamide-phosphate guanylyltransferase [Litoreibacter ponti]PTX54441.1 adenosylcobinamide kinase /adenosylcobinamide-phosphate guanylyltransferase [Litoreibacter ponti]
MKKNVAPRSQPLPRLSLVLGGAASGKSGFAEQLVQSAPDLRRIYLASAQAFDDEMRAKIARHREIRAADGWETVEEPLAVAEALNARHDGEIVLFDCATLWLTNQMMAEADLAAKTAALASALATCAAPVVIVSNELGQGVVPELAMARRFREAHGRMNQTLAVQADLVVHVIAGLPQVLKGQLQ